MYEKPKELDVVALLNDIPERGLLRGQVGTILDVYGDGSCEVEFADDTGKTYACLALKPEQLLELRFRADEVA